MRTSNVIESSEDGYGVERPIRFSHYNLEFGVVVSKWADLDGAREAADFLKNWVRALSIQEARSLHERLVQSDAAYGDDPVWSAPEMDAVMGAQLSARNCGLAVRGGVHDNHQCNCFLVPLPYGD